MSPRVSPRRVRFRQQGVDSEETAAAFVNLLLTASEQEAWPIYVTITMRSDYLGDCSQIPGLAEAVRTPENFIGIPFFSPVEKMDPIEIICGEKTSDETLARVIDYTLAIRKYPIVVNDGRGFFTTRVFSMYLLEAVAMLAEGIDPATIEQAPWTGGVRQFVKGYPGGRTAFLERADELAARYGKRFEVPASLRG